MPSINDFMENNRRAIQQAIEFTYDVFGNKAPHAFEVSEYIPPEGSAAPQDLFRVTTFDTYQNRNEGKAFSFLLGFDKQSRPYLYEKATYQETTPGVLPVNENPKGNFLYEWEKRSPGSRSTPSAVVSPLQHIMLLASSVYSGEPGSPRDTEKLENRSPGDLWQTAREFGSRVRDVSGKEVKIPGIPYSIKSGESSAKELDDLTSYGPVVSVQNTRKDVYNAEYLAEEKARSEASAGRIPGLPRENYALDIISSTHRITTAESIGYRNPIDNSISALAKSPTKAAHVLKRPYNPLMIFSGNKKAWTVKNENDYVEQTAVMREGDPTGRQLVMNALVPLIGAEGSRASGSSHFRAPSGLMTEITSHGKRARLEATFRSTLDMPIEGLSGPEDLFYQSEGKTKFRIDIADRFTEEGLEKRNVIGPGSRVRVADVVGRSGGRTNRTPLSVSTKERHTAVLGKSMYLPLEWLDDDKTKGFIDDTLIPALREQGIQPEFRSASADKHGRRAAILSLDVAQGEPLALKNATKATNSPIPGNMYGLWHKSQSGRMSLYSDADAIIPFKNPVGVMWSAFSVADRNRQKEMLYAVAGKNNETRSQIDKYYEGLEEGQVPSMNVLSERMGVGGPMELLEQMTENVIGRKQIVKRMMEGGVPLLDNAELKRQRENFQKYGIARDYGYVAIGEFTEETKNDFIEMGVRNLLKYQDEMKPEGSRKITEAKARALVASAYHFTPGAKLSGGQQLWQGFELQEVIRGKMGFNPIAEMSGIAREKNAETESALLATGNSDIVEFKKRTRPEMGATQYALHEMLTAISATNQKEGIAGKYIHVSDRKTGGLNWNREEFINTLGMLEAESSSPLEALNKLQKITEKQFGAGLGLEFNTESGKVFLPDLQAIQRLDSDTAVLSSGEENEVERSSASRLPDRVMKIMGNLAYGEDEYESIASYERLAAGYLKSGNLEKTAMGIYSPYETNTLLKPGQIFLSNEAIQRYFKIMGGDEFNSGEFKKYLNMFLEPIIGVAERQPHIASAIARGEYGSIAPNEVLTEGNSELGEHIAEVQRESGIRSMDIVASPYLASVLGDSDADKFGLYLAIGRATGDTGKFISMIAGLTPEERKKRVTKILDEQGPEVQEKTMEYFFGGGQPDPLALEKYPALYNQVSYMMDIMHGERKDSIVGKTIAKNLGENWKEIGEKASGQKTRAMADTHNQLLRRVQSAGMALGMEPLTYMHGMAAIGTKFSQLAVDQDYESQALVKMFKGAFLSEDNGHLNIMFDKGNKLLGNDADFKGFRWSKEASIDKVLTNIVGTLMKTDDLTARDYAFLFGNYSEGSTYYDKDNKVQFRGGRSQLNKKNVTTEEAAEIADSQIKYYEEKLVPRFQEVLDAPTEERAGLLEKMRRGGLISEKSLAGIGLLSRLSEYMEGKLTGSEDDQEKAKRFKAIAGATGVDLEGNLYSRVATASKDIFEILKGDKNSPGMGAWKYAGTFAATARNFAKLGITHNPVIQDWMKFWGGAHGLYYDYDDKGNATLKTMIGNKAISSEKQLADYQARMRHNKSPLFSNLTDMDKAVIAHEQEIIRMRKELRDAGVPEEEIQKQIESMPRLGGTPSQASGAGGQPPVTPPPPTDVSGATSMPTGGPSRRQGISGTSLYAMSKGVSYTSVEANAALFSNLASGLGGIVSNLHNFGVDARGRYTLAGETPYDQYRTLMGMQDPTKRNDIRYSIRQNKDIMGAIWDLREMRKYAPEAAQAYGMSTFEGIVASAMIGVPEAHNYLLNEAGDFGKLIAGILPFADKDIEGNWAVDLGSPRWAQKGDQATYLAHNKLRMEQYKALAGYLNNPSIITKQPLLKNDLKAQVLERNIARRELEKLETEIGVSDEDRLSSVFSYGLSDPGKFASEFQSRKERWGSKYKLLSKDQQDLILEAEEAQTSVLKSYSEYTSPKGTYERDQYKVGAEFMGEMAKYSLALKDIREGTNKYLKTLNLSKEEMDKFVKSVKDGTFVEQAKAKEIEQSRSAALKTIRASLGPDAETGETLTSGEIKKLQTGGYGDTAKMALEDYLKLEDAEVALAEGKKVKSLASRVGRGARNILSGFGLMYLRSIGGMITGTGDVGYAESVQYNAALNQAMARNYGPVEGYAAESDVAAYRALMAGGGRRALNNMQAYIYQNNPGLMDVGKGVFATVAGGGSTAWLMEQIGMGAAAGPVSVAAGAAIGIGAYALNQWGRVTDQASWLASEGDKFATFVQNRTGFGTGERNNIWDYAGIATQMWGYGAASLLNIAPEWRKDFEENARLLGIRERAQALVDSGKEKNLDRALTSMGVSEEDKFAINKAKAYEITTKMMPSISTEGRLAAAQQLQYFKMPVDETNIELMNKLGQAYDSGIDYMTAAQGLVITTGNKYAEDRGEVLKSLAYSGMSGEKVEKLTTVLQLAEQLGPQWSTEIFGGTVEEISASLNVTPRRTGKKPIQKYETWSNLLAGPNADIATLLGGLQASQLSAGLTPEEIPEGLESKLSVQERESITSEILRKQTGFSALEAMSQKSGISTIKARQYWNTLSRTGTLSQQDAFLNMIGSPSPTTFGSFVSSMGITSGLEGFAQKTVNVAGQDIPLSAMLFTGANQNGLINGRAWGEASLAMPGISANFVANQIWGNWQTAGGSAQGAINAMVKGFDVNGKTFYGQQGLQGWQNDFSYKMAMASAGIQMRQVALSEAFTTGKGLGAYGFTEGRGFWALEDEQRALQRREQEFSFENQEWSLEQAAKRLALSEKYYTANTSLNRQQTLMQRQWTQQDWAYQENVRDLQWGWKQEDFQENVRFMTGRDRRLAERQMKRDTIMHDLEGEQIDKQKERQQELWRLEDRRFDLEKKQHAETLKMQQEEIAHDKMVFEQQKRFYAEEKKLEDESIRLQRAYYLEQQKLQKESAGLQAYQAQVQKDLSDAMLEYNDHAATQQGLYNLLSQSISGLNLAVKELLDTLDIKTLTPEEIKQEAKNRTPNGTITVNLNVDGARLASVIVPYIE